MALSAVSAAAADDAPKGKDGIVAVVNAEPITHRELANEAVRRHGREVLDGMINRHLILQECEARGSKVTPAEVNAEIKRQAKKFGLPVDQYLGLLRDERGIHPTQYGREIVWPMLALRRLAADRVEVTPEEFQQAFTARYGEAVKCRMIMIADASTADSLHARAVAEPNHFGELAKQFSNDEMSAPVGGLVPPFRRHAGDPTIEDAVFALDNGGISPVITLGDQHVFFQAIRRIPATQPTGAALVAVKEQIHDQIRDGKLQGVASELFEELQRRANVVTVLGNAELEGQHPGVAALINGQPVTMKVLGDQCVQRHGEDVAEIEINRRLLKQQLRKEKKSVDPKELAAEVARAAKAYGYVTDDGRGDVDAWIAAVTGGSGITRDVYVADSVWPTVALKTLVGDSVRLTREDIDHGYEAAYGPKAEVLAIVLSDQRTAQKVWKTARDNPGDEAFGDLAERYSVEPISASNRGQVPPIRRHGGQPAIEKEVFAMQPGDLSGIIVTGGQYMVLKVTGFTDPVVSDRASVETELVADLTEQKLRRAMAEKMESIRAASEIDNFLASARPEAKVARR